MNKNLSQKNKKLLLVIVGISSALVLVLAILVLPIIFFAFAKTGEAFCRVTKSIDTTILTELELTTSVGYALDYKPTDKTVDREFISYGGVCDTMGLPDEGLVVNELILFTEEGEETVARILQIDGNEYQVQSASGIYTINDADILAHD